MVWTCCWNVRAIVCVSVSMQVHVERVHMKKKQHCSFCNKMYSDVKTLLKHMEKQHNLKDAAVQESYQQLRCHSKLFSHDHIRSLLNGSWHVTSPFPGWRLVRASGSSSTSAPPATGASRTSRTVTVTSWSTGRSSPSPANCATTPLPDWRPLPPTCASTSSFTCALSARGILPALRHWRAT